MPVVEINDSIEAPPQVVWDFFSDLRRIPEYTPSEVPYISDGPIQQGTVYRERGQFLGSTSESEWLITEFDPPRRQEHFSNESTVRVTVTLVLEPVGNGTRLSQTTDFQVMPRFRPLGWLLEKLVVQRMISKQLREMVQGAKQMIEAERA